MPRRLNWMLLAKVGLQTVVSTFALHGVMNMDATTVPIRASVKVMLLITVASIAAMAALPRRLRIAWFFVDE